MPTPAGLVVVVAAVAGARLGLRPISDNSELVHLRTGIDLVRTWHVPRSDPYSFTAPGHRWIVQSWMPSLLYGLANSVGHHALVFEQGALMAAVAAVIALSARSSSVWRTGIATTLAVAASAPGWSPRPLLFELLCLGLLILVVIRNRSPWWLLPIMWVWVNSHGSWPIAAAWLGAYVVGSAIDSKRLELRYVWGFVAGMAVSLVNPLTWRLVTFPFITIQKRSTFQTIVEWRSPNFQDSNSLLVLIFVTLSLVVLMRRSVPWRHLLPVCGFLALGLLSERNLAPLAIVLAPALAVSLDGPPVELPAVLATVLERVNAVGRSVPWRAFVSAAAVAVLAVLVVVSVGQPTLDLSSYPVGAAAFLQRTGRFGPQHRIAEIDVIGCYLIWRAGPSTKVFIDDRYDMYPKSVVTDATLIATADPSAPDVLDSENVDTVLWAANGTLPVELERTGEWHQAYDDGHWLVLERDVGD